jgi:hypothetical protein
MLKARRSERIGRGSAREELFNGRFIDLRSRGWEWLRSSNGAVEPSLGAIVHRLRRDHRW